MQYAGGYIAKLSWSTALKMANRTGTAEGDVDALTYIVCITHAYFFRHPTNRIRIANVTSKTSEDMTLMLL